ncbi:MULTISPECIES: M28 family metallopeptidase [unclassified Azospirillum]|uniref:M28 family metallopeptidase n=1 Tax=unclassified Azospirillum TaxID=2630922 RepID=UPI000B75DF6D|nr:MULTISPECIES: M28 family metallopeptidase [unclassified Azospirillum]SNT16818.1 Zn-dependent amino- or carboxypeptidase, M28 family [Azospirillum sp. RU38E]SNT29033.1 Zn-dependent amino- or carboxypeptidase, M28 family [Azospirillum sp. RU37A]
MKKRFLLASVALCAGFAAQAAEPTFDMQRFSGDIRTLSSDAFEGRAPASAGEVKTVDFLIQRMKEAGLEPGGPQGSNGVRSWTQDVPLLKSDIIGTPSLSLTVNGKAKALSQGKEIAVRAALTGDTAVSLKDVPLVFVGYGVKAPERDWDDFKGVDLRGKIMVVLVNDPDFEGPAGRFGGKAMTYYGRWTYKFEEAARQGAIGTLIVHETDAASYGWATVASSNTNTMFDIVRDKPRSAHSPLEGWIQRDVAVELFKASGLDFEKLRVAARSADFRPVALKATLDATYQVKPETIISKNVLGRIAGTSHADETLIYSAHWDHLGVGAPDAKGDRIFNGAVDNASGTAALLELARAYKAAPAPARSVLFLAVTAEEKGLLGSSYYAANPVWPLARTVGVLNMDAVISPGPAKDFTISGQAKLDLLDLLIAEGAKRHRTYTPDPKVEAGGFFRSDHFPFAKQGVPAISYGAGDDLIDGGKAAGKAWGDAYVKAKYHQQSDEWSPDWNLEGTRQDLGLLYAVGRNLADSRIWPNWSQEAEFRAIRDASAAERQQ